MAELIKSSGRKTNVNPKNDTDFTLEELQKYVGGNIQIVKTNDDRLMIINEEGKIFDLDINRRATKLYEYGSCDIIMGDVLVIDKNQIL
jgi:hypothetical protein